MSDSQWERYGIEDKVTTILRSIAKDDPGHYGQPFFTAYQIAIRFADNYPEEFAAIGLPIGGLGTGQYTSLSQYLAGELSRRIKARTIQHIEIGLIDKEYVHEMLFAYEGNSIAASQPSFGYGISVFRLV